MRESACGVCASAATVARVRADDERDAAVPANVFLQGFVIGLCIAAPVGPIGVLCIRRSLTDGRLAGLVTGLGAASADALYGCVAAFGLTAVSSFLIGQRFCLALLGGTFLCFLGVRSFFTRPAAMSADVPPAGLASAYAGTFVLTVANPMTILSFVAIFAAVGLESSGSTATAPLLVAGVFVGSAAWWFVLSGGVSFLRSRLDVRLLRAIHRLSGAVITAFGVYALSRVAEAWL